MPLSEVDDTGAWEVVYNLRVADYRTYFVGDDTWSFAAWAHNAYTIKRNGAAAPAGVSIAWSNADEKDIGQQYQAQNRSLRPTSQRVNDTTLEMCLNKDAGCALVFTPSSGSTIITHGFANEGLMNYSLSPRYNKAFYEQLVNKLKARLADTPDAREQALIQELIAALPRSLGNWIRYDATPHAEAKAFCRLLDLLLLEDSGLLPLWSGKLTFVVDGVFNSSPHYGGPCPACTLRLLSLKQLLGSQAAIQVIYNQDFKCPQWITLQFTG
ncbi:MAG: hypothetical protein WHU94_12965 [Thermogemmata sp.]|uniref:Uncharacterized protein n=1 Tax=Thermogemmata fonticola TaxID=2755323 RepID=A0A7V8VH37_9BACT|nr:hypothetical protein [Thermogemmata fonticola]MBA2227939.1 hypothetical protein [Thermogemmata fonticola]MCX8139821.1 hypothetical protein [Gemmataceae bacterium]